MIIIKKTFCIILSALAVLLAFAGCGSARDPDADPLDTGTGAPETEPEPLPELPDTAISLIDCAGMEGAVNEIVSAGYASAAVVTHPYSDWTERPGEESDGGVAESSQKLYMVDLSAGGASFMFDLPNGVSILGVRKNGEIAAQDLINDKILILSAKGETLREYDCASAFTVYEPEKDLIYVYDSKQITRYDPASDSAEVLYSAPWSTSISAFDPIACEAVIETTAANEGSGCRIKLLSLEDGGKVDLSYEGSAFVSFSKNALILDQTEGVFDDNGEYIGFKSSVYVIPRSGEDAYSYKLPDDPMLSISPSSRFAFGMTYLEADISDSGIDFDVECRLFDVESGLMSDVIEELDGAYNVISAHVDGCDRFVAAVNRDPFDESYPHESGTKLYLISPEYAEIDQKLEPIGIDNGGGNDETPFVLSESYAAQRERADRIEEKFGIRILLGDEVKNAAPNSSYGRVSFEESLSDEPLSERVRMTDKALDLIEKGLSLYPEGFFKTFVNPEGEGGLRILVDGNITNDSGSFAPGGVAYSHGAWYTIEICIGMLQYGMNTLHHEMWHAVECRICDEIPHAFWFEDWSALNPEGFEYSNDFDNYYYKDDAFKYLLSYDGSVLDENVYFSQIYSTVTAMEDRATLIELVTDEFYTPEVYDGIPTAYEYVCKFPHLKAKLDVLAEYAEEVFGAVYWMP